MTHLAGALNDLDNFCPSSVARAPHCSLRNAITELAMASGLFRKHCVAHVRNGDEARVRAAHDKLPCVDRRCDPILQALNDERRSHAAASHPLKIGPLGRFRLQPRRLTVPAVLPEGRTIARRKERVGNRLQMLFGWQAWIKNLPELHHNLFARRHLTAGREQDQADYPVGLVRRCGSRYTIAEVLTEHKGPID